jgi:glycosyltransferase involved in cell wall biosynthesis
MRILATVERYAPAIGGAERVVQRLSEGLAARGHEVHVLTGGANEHTELGAVHVHRLDLSGNEARGIRGDRSSVIELLAAVNSDLVFNYAAQTWTTDCCFDLLQRSKRPRMVLAPCGFSGLGDRRYTNYFELMPARLRSYDALILHSAVYRDWAFAVRAGAERITVIPNGADRPATGSSPVQLPRGRIAVTVGSHVLSKGHAEFARAIRALARDRQVGGVIVAPRRTGLDALRGCQLTCDARSRLLPMHVVDGAAPGIVGSVLADADLFLFTSRLECAPLVILEAMAAGVPWVSYDVGNVSELRGGVVAGSFNELVSVAGEILDEQRPELGQAGRESWGANHRWEKIVGRYESVFEEVMTAPLPAPA